MFTNCIPVMCAKNICHCSKETMVFKVISKTFYLEIQGHEEIVFFQL